MHDRRERIERGFGPVVLTDVVAIRILHGLIDDGVDEAGRASRIFLNIIELVDEPLLSGLDRIAHLCLISSL